MSEYIHQLYTDILTTGMQFGMQEPQAREFAATLIDRVQTNYAGDEVYIPGPNKHRRNECIRLMFNGVNHEVVCAEFGISKATLYRVIKE